jgi:iron(III) transport system substrate-binding protein
MDNLINNRTNKCRRILALTLAVLMPVLCACGQSEREKQIRYISDKYSVPDENQLIVYTSHKEEVYIPIIREFESRTGIWVDIHAGGTTEMMQAAREASERGECDIMFGGGIESYEAQSDCFLSYTTSEKASLDPDYVSADGKWTGFTELPIVFIYNKKLLSDNGAPHNWKDLFDARWKGEIAFADLGSSGTSYTIISTMEQIFDEPYDSVLRRFHEQLGGEILNSSGDIIPKVSDGTYLIGITLEETAKKYMNLGYDIAMIYPGEGTSAVPDGCAMLKNAPHRYNAGKFIDFVVGYDTQEYAMNNFYRRPIRGDIELSADYGQARLIRFDFDKAAREEKDIFSLWEELTKEEG